MEQTIPYDVFMTHILPNAEHMVYTQLSKIVRMKLADIWESLHNSRDVAYIQMDNMRVLPLNRLDCYVRFAYTCRERKISKSYCNKYTIDSNDAIHYIKFYTSTFQTVENKYYQFISHPEYIHHTILMDWWMDNNFKLTSNQLVLMLLNSVDEKNKKIRNYYIIRANVQKMINRINESIR